MDRGTRGRSEPYVIMWESSSIRRVILGPRLVFPRVDTKTYSNRQVTATSTLLRYETKLSYERPRPAQAPSLRLLARKLDPIPVANEMKSFDLEIERWVDSIILGRRNVPDISTQDTGNHPYSYHQEQASRQAGRRAVFQHSCGVAQSYCNF